MAARKASLQRVAHDVPTRYRCPKHPQVQVTLYVPAVPYCTRCARPLQRVGYAQPVQEMLF